MSPPPALEAPTHATSIIYLEDVTVNYDGFKALSRLNFFMDRRELRVVIGPNGAGKTTLLDVVSGRVKPESGRVIFGHNTDLLPLRENQIAQLGIGRKFQTPSVFVNLTVWDNVELSLRRASKGVFAALRQRDAREDRDRILHTLETVQLSDKAEGKAGALSHGEKQWLEIGMMIAQDPELLLVDEPVAGMTDEETERTGQLLESIAADRSVLVIEHDMEFVRQIARQVTAWSPDRRARAGIGYVPQGREIFPHLSVEENLRMALLGCGRAASLDEPLALFPALKPLLARKGGVLSGGEQQMLAIGRALLTRPKLLMLDEPTEGIQPSIILEIEDALRRIKAELKLAVLLVEQYLDFAERLADKYVIMAKGAVVAAGATRDLRPEMVRQHLAV